MKTIEDIGEDNYPFPTMPIASETRKNLAEGLGSERHLLCQVHPVNLFNREMQKMWKKVDTTIGPDEIFAGFAVSVSDQQVSVTEQWIDCIPRLVTQDFDQKAWNKTKEFDLFNAPLQNPDRRAVQQPCVCVHHHQRAGRLRQRVPN